MITPKNTPIRSILTRLAASKPIGILAIAASALTMSFVAHDAAQAARLEALQTQTQSSGNKQAMASQPPQSFSLIDHSSVVHLKSQVELDVSLLHSNPTAYQSQTELPTPQ